MVRKSFQIHASKITLANAVRLRRVGCLLKVECQFGIEFICKLWRWDILVVVPVIDVPGDVRGNLRLWNSRRISCAGSLFEHLIAQEK